jgi:phospholipid transport system substrate-binding protein
LASASSAYSLDCSEPKKYVESVTTDVIKLLDNKAVNETQKEANLVKMFNQVADTDWMGRFALGKSWRTIDAKKQTEYLKTYNTFMTNTYVSKFREYDGQKITVNDVKKLDGDNLFYVSSTVSDAKTKDVSLGYRLSKTGACYKVTDIVAEGVSLINTQRQDFNAVVGQKGVDGLISSLNAKGAENKVATTK